MNTVPPRLRELVSWHPFLELFDLSHLQRDDEQHGHAGVIQQARRRVAAQHREAKRVRQSLPHRDSPEEERDQEQDPAHQARELADHLSLPYRRVITAATRCNWCWRRS